MILAVPLIAVIGIIMRHIEHPVADGIVQILEGRFRDLESTPTGSPAYGDSQYGSTLSLNADAALDSSHGSGCGSKQKKPFGTAKPRLETK
jgi:hypothetical protein